MTDPHANGQPRRLLNAAELALSPIVRDAAMTRDRPCAGQGSYSQHLGLDLERYLDDTIEASGQVRWLDLCCGTGRALIEAGQQLQRTCAGRPIALIGVDLVDAFQSVPTGVGALCVEANVSSWRPEGTFDLITCVHGLPYVGDKLDLLARALTWVADDGLLTAHLDLVNIRLEGGSAGSRHVMRALREAGIEYDARRRIISAFGPRHVRFGLNFLGADDQGDPNITGQRAVHSHYRAC